MHLTRPHCHKARCWKPSWHKHSNTERSHNGSHVCSHSNYTPWQEGAELSTFLFPPLQFPKFRITVSMQELCWRSFLLSEKTVREFGGWQPSCSSLLEKTHVEFGYVGTFEHAATYKWHILYAWWTEFKSLVNWNVTHQCVTCFLFQKRKSKKNMSSSLLLQPSVLISIHYHKYKFFHLWMNHFAHTEYAWLHAGDTAECHSGQNSLITLIEYPCQSLISFSRGTISNAEQFCN